MNCFAISVSKSLEKNFAHNIFSSLSSVMNYCNENCIVLLHIPPFNEEDDEAIFGEYAETNNGGASEECS